jgi:hypothetical protein
MSGNPILAATSAHSFEKARGDCSEPSSLGKSRASSASFPEPEREPDLKLLPSIVA